MNKLSLEKDELLLRYLDSELNKEDRLQIEAELEASELLRSRLDELKAVNLFLLQKASLESPSKNFTQKVMSGLDAKLTTSFSPRQGVLLLLGTIVASGIALALLSAGVFDAPTVPLVLDSPLKNNWFNIPSISIPFNGKILINGILILNLGLALVLLDRTILKPIFQKRVSAGL